MLFFKYRNSTSLFPIKFQNHSDIEAFARVVKKYNHFMKSDISEYMQVDFIGFNDVTKTSRILPDKHR